VQGNIIHHTPAYSSVYVGAPSIISTPAGDYFVSLNFTEIQGGEIMAMLTKQLFINLLTKENRGIL
jgi:hypothetical protein